MIVCSCNVLSDHDVRAAVTAGPDTPRTAKQVYGCLGCSAECGRCARTIKQIMSEALTGALTEALADKLEVCNAGCCSGCPHSHHDTAETSPGSIPTMSDGHDHIAATA
jgi:bacterioferritin-associated ferredoxin